MPSAGRSRTRARSRRCAAICSQRSARERPVQPQPSEIESGIDAFLRHAAIERGLSPRTVEAYGRDLAQLAGFLDAAKVRRLGDVAPEHLAGFASALAARGLAARSRARALVATRRLLRFAHADGAFR